LGHVGFFDPKRVVAFPELSLGSGAIRGWDKRNAFTFSMLSSLATHYEFDIEATWDSLPEHLQKIILHGWMLTSDALSPLAHLIWRRFSQARMN
jgi:excinuclease ABC subunit A